MALVLNEFGIRGRVGNVRFLQAEWEVLYEEFAR